MYTYTLIVILAGLSEPQTLANELTYDECLTALYTTPYNPDGFALVCLPTGDTLAYDQIPERLRAKPELF